MLKIGFAFHTLQVIEYQKKPLGVQIKQRFRIQTTSLCRLCARYKYLRTRLPAGGFLHSTLPVHYGAFIARKQVIVDNKMLSQFNHQKLNSFSVANANNKADNLHTKFDATGLKTSYFLLFLSKMAASSLGQFPNARFCGPQKAQTVQNGIMGARADLSSVFICLFQQVDRSRLIDMLRKNAFIFKILEEFL